MQIKLSTSFLRSLRKFIKGNVQNNKNYAKAISRFKSNPNYPSLNLEKLKGTKVWTIRIDRGNRIFFSWINESTALFIDIGKHDKYKRY